MSIEQQASRPQILLVDSEPTCLTHLEQAVRSRYGQVAALGEEAFSGVLSGPHMAEFDVLVIGRIMNAALLRLLASKLMRSDSLCDSLILLQKPQSPADKDQLLQIFAALRQNLFFFSAPRADTDDLLNSLELAANLVQERKLRRRQEDHLVNELAERKIMEARLKYLVSHDELTGLANRRSLEKNIEMAIYRAIKFSKGGALLYIDLDRFNVINDVEGYETGDRLLVEVVGILRGQLKPAEYFARIGSDEFCIFIENTSRVDAMGTAERIRQRIDDFVMVTENDTFSITASIGVAILTPHRHMHPNAFIVQAHQACIVGKAKGRNCVHLYNDNDTELLLRHDDVLWFPLIRRALVDDNFELFFQPVVELETGLASHYEVLLRMRGPDGGVFSPEKFIPVAERTGLITHVDLWVVDKATDFLAGLPESQQHVSLNINLSGAAFSDPSVFQLLQKKLELNWIDPARITLEITESAAISNLAQTCEMISRIRALGCRFAIDDFGTGFSSFHYLKYFNVDFLKIDGQFISNLLNDETDQVLVKAVIDIARQLGKKTVAEYVHDHRILSLLKELRVDYVQGYLLGKPSRQLLESAVLPVNDMLLYGIESTGRECSPGNTV